MKATGMTRKLDELGRVVLPIELRRSMGIEIKDALEIFVDDNRVILKKYQPGCIFCGNADKVTHYKGKYLCKRCLKKIKEA
ncbi:AbrB/MazE/SpoVT family DNA-binding domain-containing protein [Agathobaculum sp. NTUH-O15-33]|uniref:AbrB/MazE/SpoVT family DNA-binding domain-containing protein n=1 Tax=Agathobaculum sp. NTUH-O15-33 TaxID=3079302 RepID=UPI0029588376|nr:AbrB/MazE/SpoVT family DNA-binding domain-containing protein [Agathobaculum sp. NTUH-O15-33]WNX83802.1 AbrB/MazE/SpoVT family DNA-binding domain-containing protein [Agathobaculum sp. NTUH-O15-33]